MFAWMAPTTGGNATHGWSGPHYILVRSPPLPLTRAERRVLAASS
jgi:hypothetical protein